MMKIRLFSQLAQPWKTRHLPNLMLKQLPGYRGSRIISAVILGLVFALVGTIATAAAEQTRIAIAIDPDGQTCLLGGGVSATALSAESILKSLKPRQNYRLYNLLGRQSAVLWPIGKPKRVEDDSCQPHIRQQLSLMASETGTAQVAIFDGGGSKRIAVMPKILQVMNTDNEKYRQVLATFLKSQNLSEAPLKIHQLIRTDLDGDGKHEIIINAINTARNLDRKGEYSIVLVEREIDQKRVVETIQSEITLEDSDLPVVLWENTIAAIADIDGDGHMEIIMFGQFFHGQGWDLVTHKNLTTQRPVLCGCGG